MYIVPDCILADVVQICNPGKGHEALAHLDSGTESPGAWHIQSAHWMGTYRAAKMGRREAWARFLAYDVSLSSSVAAHTN